MEQQATFVITGTKRATNTTNLLRLKQLQKKREKRKQRRKKNKMRKKNIAHSVNPSNHGIKMAKESFSIPALSFIKIANKKLPKSNINDTLKQIYCDICDVPLCGKTNKSYLIHIRGKKHQKKLQQRKLIENLINLKNDDKGNIDDLENVINVKDDDKEKIDDFQLIATPNTNNRNNIDFNFNFDVDDHSHYMEFVEVKNGIKNGNNNGINGFNFDFDSNHLSHSQPQMKKRKSNYKVKCPTYCAPKSKG
eukprot:537507_1